jgi:prepilin-type N-terminal cleavage/methylation domain-containing protein
MPRYRRGFTLVELLVVIAIIGVLVALLLPAVQAARESARRMQCQNNLKQFGLAFQNHNDMLGHLPTNGWGYFWVGDPDLGFGIDQPGGWTFNILPYCEQNAVYNIAKGKVGQPKKTDLAAMVGVPIKFFYCPSRRKPGLYPITGTANEQNFDHVSIGAKIDYAVCAGDQEELQGPGVPIPLPAPPMTYTGISFVRSTVRFAEITDGTSNTLMVGEKQMGAPYYLNGLEGGDNENIYVGWDNDHTRTTNSRTTGNNNQIRFPPRMDTREDRILCFGSAHPAGFNGVLCDGSVRVFTYNIDVANYMRLGNRADGQTLTLP